MNYTNNQICHVFGFSRDDVNRLTADHVIEPEVLGQGIASMYSEADMERLLDAKIYLMAGYRIADMKKIFTEDYASDEGIAKQIRIYKRRIRLLEVIQAMRSNLLETSKLSVEQQARAMVVQHKIMNMPEYGSDEYYVLTWETIQLVFILDYLCQEESLKADRKTVLNQCKTAYLTFEKLISIGVVEADVNELRKVLFANENMSFEEQEIKEATKEVYEYIVANKEAIVEMFTPSKSDTNDMKLDDKTGSVYRERMRIINEFVLDYFFDEEALFCLITNFLHLINEIDKDSCLNGEFRFKGEEVKKHKSKKKHFNYLE